jgi:glucosamine--fructose-6-phosphate aminotransferase (isomerizing)
LASDVTALLGKTERFVFLEDGDVAEVRRDSLRVWDQAGNPVGRTAEALNWAAADVSLKGFDHYMQKEIFEQPAAIAATISKYVDSAGVIDVGVSTDRLEGIQNVCILACGTSRHAALVGQALIEGLARVPVEVDYGSEYRHRQPIVKPNTLVIAITQSGETADTLSALDEIQRLAKLQDSALLSLAICNVSGSQVTRRADVSLLTQAGPEIGVASTKAFTTQLTALVLLAIRLGQIKGTLSAEAARRLTTRLSELPAKVEACLDVEEQIKTWAAQSEEARSALYLGRGLLFPIALEGALKLKEISYIHAEGYPAGEMKHGPIALIDDAMPIFGLVPNDANRARMLGNLQEAAARNGRIYALVEAGERALSNIAWGVVEVPRTEPELAPILYTIPLQLLAYHSALLRRCDVDKPRNLAKSVTVE